MSGQGGRWPSFLPKSHLSQTRAVSPPCVASGTPRLPWMRVSRSPTGARFACGRNVRLCHLSWRIGTLRCSVDRSDQYARRHRGLGSRMTYPRETHADAYCHTDCGRDKNDARSADKIWGRGEIAPFRMEVRVVTHPLTWALVSGIGLELCAGNCIPTLGNACYAKRGDCVSSYAAVDKCENCSVIK
jgi:hypothetical protein